MRVYRLIERVHQKYAEAIRYVDRGTTVVSAGEAVARVEFETSFEGAPRRLSFSFTVDVLEGKGKPKRFSHGLHMDGLSFHATSDPPLSSPPPKSLYAGLARFAGITFGSAGRVPHLLMPDDLGGGVLFFDSGKLILKDPSVIDDARHHAIALGDSQRSTVIYVNEATLLVRRIVEAQVVTDYVITDFA